MKIIIVGAGFTGIQLAKLLCSEKNNTVTLIDNDDDAIRHCSNMVDCTVINEDGNDLEVLIKAGIEKADALVCVTASDEVNMITCSLVDAVFPDILKIARVRNYAYYAKTTQAENKRTDEFTSKHRPLYGINYMINPDVEAAEAIVTAVENGAVGNVLTFDESDLQLTRITVNEGSSFDGITLKEIRSKTEVTFLVAYIEKDGETSLPAGDSIVNAGNVLGILVHKSDIPELLSLCGSEQKNLRRVALIGAGRIGTIIAEKLLAHTKKARGLSKIFFKTRNDIDLAIIDSDSELTKEASERFPRARVICGDATDENLLREEKLTDYDLAICATHNHELNMILSAYLEKKGVGQSISLVTGGDFVTIGDMLGVDVCVPLRDTVVDSIMSHLRGKAVKEIHTVNSGELEIVECEVGTGSKASGKLLKEIADSGSFLVLLSRSTNGEQYSIASGNTQFYPGDHIVLITQADNSKKILSFFAGKAD
ncbi:MAG: NAD-binding protein [Treponema sp.]|nr:NAD-binding protein [Treponema sp.]